jgi:hypothetical protein
MLSWLFFIDGRCIQQILQRTLLKVFGKVFCANTLGIEAISPNELIESF